MCPFNLFLSVYSAASGFPLPFNGCQSVYVCMTALLFYQNVCVCVCDAEAGAHSIFASDMEQTLPRIEFV